MMLSNGKVVKMPDKKLTDCGNSVDKAIIEENKYLKRVIEHQRLEIAILREKLTICREYYSREDKFI